MGPEDSRGALTRREREVAWLSRVIDRARQGIGYVLVVRDEAGIGKKSAGGLR